MDTVTTVICALHAQAIKLRDIYHEENDIYQLTHYQMETVWRCADLVWKPEIGILSQFYMLFILYQMGYYEYDPLSADIEKCVDNSIPILKRLGLIHFNHDYGSWEIA